MVNGTFSQQTLPCRRQDILLLLQFRVLGYKGSYILLYFVHNHILLHVLLDNGMEHCILESNRTGDVLHEYIFLHQEVGSPSVSAQLNIAS